MIYSPFSEDAILDDHLCRGILREAGEKNHRRHYRIGGVTLRIDSELPLMDQTFTKQIEQFRVSDPGPDVVAIRHRFSMPEINHQNWGQEVFARPPWIISKLRDGWIYRGVGADLNNQQYFELAVFNESHTRGQIFHPGSIMFDQGGCSALTFTPTDQILLSRILPVRQGCLFHAAGMIIQGQGLLFIGHSGAGKSTTVTKLRPEGKILCDDRIIVRRWPEGFRIHGTWSHGDVTEVSPAEAPLRAICFLKQSRQNCLVPIINPKERIHRLMFHLVRALETADWWQKVLGVVESLAKEVPIFELQCDASGEVRKVIRALVNPP